jgi:hypothetical protein
VKNPKLQEGADAIHSTSTRRSESEINVIRRETSQSQILAEFIERGLPTNPDKLLKLLDLPFFTLRHQVMFVENC